MYQTYSIQKRVVILIYSTDYCIRQEFFPKVPVKKANGMFYS